MRKTRSGRKNTGKKYPMRRRGMRTRRGGMWPFDQIKGYFSGNKPSSESSSMGMEDPRSTDNMNAPPVVPAATMEQEQQPPIAQEEPSSMTPAGEQAGGRRRRRRRGGKSKRKTRRGKSRRRHHTRKHK